MIREVFNNGNGENGAIDSFGIGLGANLAGGGINWFSRGGEEAGDLLKEGDGEFEASHEKSATSGFGKDFGELDGGDVVAKE